MKLVVFHVHNFLFAVELFELVVEQMNEKKNLQNMY